MADDLADRILAAVNAKRVGHPGRDFTARMCGHAVTVLARHRPSQTVARMAAPRCILDGHRPWPCPDVRDLAECWGVSLDD